MCYELKKMLTMYCIYSPRSFLRGFQEPFISSNSSPRGHLYVIFRNWQQLSVGKYVSLQRNDFIPIFETALMNTLSVILVCRNVTFTVYQCRRAYFKAIVCSAVLRIFCLNLQLFFCLVHIIILPFHIIPSIHSLPFLSKLPFLVK